LAIEALIAQALSTVPTNPVSEVISFKYTKNYAKNKRYDYTYIWTLTWNDLVFILVNNGLPLNTVR